MAGYLPMPMGLPVLGNMTHRVTSVQFDQIGGTITAQCIDGLLHFD